MISFNCWCLKKHNDSSGNYYRANLPISRHRLSNFGLILASDFSFFSLLTIH